MISKLKVANHAKDKSLFYSDTMRSFCLQEPQFRLSPLFHRNNNFFKVKLFFEYQQKANNGDSNMLTFPPIGKKQELALFFILLLKNNCLPCFPHCREFMLCCTDQALKVISSTPPSQLTALSFCYCFKNISPTQNNTTIIVLSMCSQIFLLSLLS